MRCQAKAINRYPLFEDHHLVCMVLVAGKYVDNLFSHRNIMHEDTVFLGELHCHAGRQADR